MWKVFNKEKPKEDGWYATTVEVKGQQRYVMSLYWNCKTQKFIDNIRQNVCEVYTVLDYKGDRLFDIGQDRTEGVVAWRKIPKAYMKGFVKESNYGN